jgi:hypothetical protein
VAVIAAIWVAACGGDSGTETTQADAPPETTTSAPARTADDIGDDIATLYLAVYDDVVATLEDRPDAATAAADLAALKEQYVQQLVELGWEREALDETDRASVDLAVRLAVGGVPDETFGAYQEAMDFYFDEAEVRELISDFNIIGQYAAFELLREQEPEEAARLGVD